MMSINTHFITTLGEGKITHPAHLSRQPLGSITTGVYKAQQIQCMVSTNCLYWQK